MIFPNKKRLCWDKVSLNQNLNGKWLGGKLIERSNESLECEVGNGDFQILPLMNIRHRKPVPHWKNGAVFNWKEVCNLRSIYGKPEQPVLLRQHGQDLLRHRTRTQIL